jgi:hypothetical protein
MPHAKVSLITDTQYDSELYDRVIVTQNVDKTNWALANDWQVYHLSPYEHTIKLEADMYIPRNIDWWWNILVDRDLNISTTIRDFRGNISTEQFYRQTFVKNNLVNTYNAMTYFSKSKTAETFYEYVKDIFENWREYRELLVYSTEDRATTDVVYSIAAKMLGYEYCTMPHFTDFSMVHMKRHINNLKTECWHDELLHEIQPDTMRINTYTQQYPVHYHSKQFYSIIEEELLDYV